MNKRFGVGFIIILIAGALVLLWVTGYYPIAFVNSTNDGLMNWRPIFAKTFKTNYSISLNFYRNQLRDAGKATLDSLETQKEIKRAVFQSLIENQIIDNELEKRFGIKDLKNMIDERINSFNFGSQQLQEGTKLIYGVSVDQLKKTVLTEQAKRDIMESALGSKGEDQIDWLGQAIKSAKVIILTSEYLWADNSVVAK